MSRGVRILEVEKLAANAWPAAETVDLDGWRLRYSEGVTRRANSVWPNQTNGSMALPDKLTAAEAFYERRRQEPAYQICDVMQPPDLDGVLAARGYATSANTEVQTAAVEDLLSRLSSSRHVPEAKVTVSETFDPDWFELYRATEDFHDHESTVRRAILQRIQPACGYALLHIGDEPAAVGLGVVERGYVGLFCMATAPRFRRQGAARAILRALLLWARFAAAQTAYLQVMKSNPAARDLYAGAGFTTLYSYHYRILHSSQSAEKTP